MKRTAYLLLVALVLSSCGVEDEAKKSTVSEARPVIGRIERLDPRVDAIVPMDAQLEVLADAHVFTEGPVWVPALSAVLYTDIPKNAIYKWSEGSSTSLWLKPSGYTGEVPRGGGKGANGLLLDDQGRLILAQHGDRRLARLNSDLQSPQPNFETLAGEFEGKRFNSPNDIAMRRNGDLYFTDPPYGLVKREKDPAKELDFQGVYRRQSDGTITLLINDLSRPNGIVFSPDEKTLYVANSGKPRVIMAYPVKDNGETSEGRVFFNSGGDGLAVDQQGNLYISGPNQGVAIVSPEGELLGRLITDQQTTNCTFGEDGSSLFITAKMYLLRVRLKVKGQGF